jgi:hypothetical protein
VTCRAVRAVELSCEDSRSSGLVNGRLVTACTLRCCSGVQHNATTDCPNVSGELPVVFNYNVLSFGTEINFHCE